MKNKLDVTNLVKIAGWIAVAVGGLMASWASDCLLYTSPSPRDAY